MLKEPRQPSWYLFSTRRAEDSAPIRSKFDDPCKPECSDPAREQVRKAVLFQLAKRPFSTLSKGISPADWRIVGFRARFYRQFAAKSDAVEEILRDCVRPDRSELTTALTSEMERLAGEPSDSSPGCALKGALPSTAISSLGEAYFSQSVGDDVLGLQMLAWVAARERPDFRSDLCELYESLEQRSEQGLSVLLESWGRTPVDPFSWADIAATFTALTEGLLLRQAVSPDRVDAKLFGQIAIGIVGGMTQASSEELDSICDRVD